MKKVRLTLASIVLTAILLSTFGCNNCPPRESDFNFILKHGTYARNELDTFRGIYVKDMVIGLPAQTRLCLTQEDMDNIYQKMVEIDFFNYPDKFSVSIAPGENIGIVTPYSSYYFKVEYDSHIKELWWDEVKI